VQIIVCVLVYYAAEVIKGTDTKYVHYYSYFTQEVEKKPGDRWMIRGPAEYVPPVQVEVVTKRKAIPLDENEGIYVRNIKTGKVRAIAGETYMLNQEEELWAKELLPGVETLLELERDALADRALRGKAGSDSKPRDKTKVVTFRVPHNAAVQIYDYKEKAARWVWLVWSGFTAQELVFVSR